MGYAPTVIALLIIIASWRAPPCWCLVTPLCASPDVVISSCGNYSLSECDTGNTSYVFIIVNIDSVMSCPQGNEDLNLVVNNSGRSWALSGLHVKPTPANMNGSLFGFLRILVQGKPIQVATEGISSLNAATLSWVYFGLPSFFPNIAFSLEAALLVNISCLELAGNEASSNCPSVSIIRFGNTAGGELSVLSSFTATTRKAMHISTNGARVCVVDLDTVLVNRVGVVVFSKVVHMSAVSGGNLVFARLPRILKNCTVWIRPGLGSQLTMESSVMVDMSPPTADTQLNALWSDVSVAIENVTTMTLTGGSYVLMLVKSQGDVVLKRTLILVRSCGAVVDDTGGIMFVNGGTAANLSILVHDSWLRLGASCLVVIDGLASLNAVSLSIVACDVVMRTTGSTVFYTLVAALQADAVSDLTLELSSCNVTMLNGALTSSILVGITSTSELQGASVKIWRTAFVAPPLEAVKYTFAVIQFSSRRISSMIVSISNVAFGLQGSALLTVQRASVDHLILLADSIAVVPPAIDAIVTERVESYFDLGSSSCDNCHWILRRSLIVNRPRPAQSSLFSVSAALNNTFLVEDNNVRIEGGFVFISIGTAIGLAAVIRSASIGPLSLINGTNSSKHCSIEAVDSVVVNVNSDVADVSVKVSHCGLLLTSSNLIQLPAVTSTAFVSMLDCLVNFTTSVGVHSTSMNCSNLALVVLNCSWIVLANSFLFYVNPVPVAGTDTSVGSLVVGHCAHIQLTDRSAFLVSMTMKTFSFSNIQTIRCFNQSMLLSINGSTSVAVRDITDISIEYSSSAIHYHQWALMSATVISRVATMRIAHSSHGISMRSSNWHNISVSEIKVTTLLGSSWIYSALFSRQVSVYFGNIETIIHGADMVLFYGGVGFVPAVLIDLSGVVNESWIVLDNISEFERYAYKSLRCWNLAVFQFAIVHDSSITVSNIQLTSMEDLNCFEASWVVLTEARNVALSFSKFNFFPNAHFTRLLLAFSTVANVSITITEGSSISLQSLAPGSTSALIDLLGGVDGTLRIVVDDTSSVSIRSVACEDCNQAIVALGSQDSTTNETYVLLDINRSSEVTLDGLSAVVHRCGLHRDNNLHLAVMVTGALLNVNGGNATLLRSCNGFRRMVPNSTSVVDITVVAVRTQYIFFSSLGAIFHAVNASIDSIVRITVTAGAAVGVSPNGSLVYIRDGLLVIAAHEISITFHCTVAVNQSAVFVIQGLRGTGAEGVGMRLSLDSRNNTVLQDTAKVAVLISSLSEGNVTMTLSGFYLMFSLSTLTPSLVNMLGAAQSSLYIIVSSATILLVPLPAQTHHQGWLLRCVPLTSGASCDALLAEVTFLNTTIAYVVIPALASLLASVVVPMFADVRRFAQGSQLSAPQCDSWVLHLTSSGNGLNIAAMLENSYFSASHEILSRRRLGVIDFGGASDVVAVVGRCSPTQTQRRGNSGNVTLSASIVAVPPGPQPPLPRLLTPEAKSAVVTVMAVTSLATATSEAATVVLLVGTNCAQATAASSSPPIPLLWWHLAVIGASLPVAHFAASKVLGGLSMTKGTFPSLASTRFPHFSLCACNFLVPVVLSYGIGSGSATGVATSIAAAVVYCGAVLWMSHRFLGGASVEYVAYPPDVHAAMQRRLLDRWLQPRKRWLPIEARRGLGFLFASMDGCRRQWKLLEVGLGLVAGVLTGTAKSLRATEVGCQVSVATLAVLYAVAAVGFAVIRPHRLPSDAALVPVMFAVLSALCWLQAFAALEGDIIEVFIMLSSVVSLVGLLISVAVGVRESAFEATAVAITDEASLDNVFALKEPADCVDDPRHRLRQQEVRKKKAALVGAVSKRLKTLVSGLELAVLEAMMMDDCTVDIRERFLCELITMVCEYKTAEREIV